MAKAPMNPHDNDKSSELPRAGYLVRGKLCLDASVVTWASDQSGQDASGCVAVDSASPCSEHESPVVSPAPRTVIRGNVLDSYRRNGANADLKTDQPAAANSFVRKPIAVMPAVGKPAAKRRMTPEPIAVQPRTVPPDTTKPVAEKPVAGRPVTERRATLEPVAVKPVPATPGTRRLIATSALSSDAIPKAVLAQQSPRSSSTPLQSDSVIQSTPFRPEAAPSDKAAAYLAKQRSRASSNDPVRCADVAQGKTPSKGAGKPVHASRRSRRNSLADTRGGLRFGEMPLRAYRPRDFTRLLLGRIQSASESPRDINALIDEVQREFPVPRGNGGFQAWRKRLMLPWVLCCAVGLNSCTALLAPEAGSEVRQLKHLAIGVQRYTDRNGKLPERLDQLPEFPGTAVYWPIEFQDVRNEHQRPEVLWIHDGEDDYAIVLRRGDHRWVHYDNGAVRHSYAD